MECIPFNRGYSKSFFLLINDLFLREGERAPNFREFWCPRNTYNGFRFCADMYRRLHRRIHKMIPRSLR